MFPWSLLSRARLHVLLYCVLSFRHLLITVQSYTSAFFADQLDSVSDLVISANTRNNVLIGSHVVASKLIHACSSLSISGQTIYAYVRSVTIYIFTAGSSLIVAGKVHASGIRYGLPPGHSFYRL